MQSVCVLGLGYIGLPTASMLASNGFRVLGVDVDSRIVDTVNGGDIHIEEPGLRILVQAAIGSGNFRAAGAPEPSDVYIIAVPTPLTPSKSADLSYVQRAAESIAPLLQRGALVLLESTCPPGTTRGILASTLENGSGLRAGKDFFLAHCPERVMPGRILVELIENDRVVGGIDSLSAQRAKELYAAFVRGQIFLTDATTAEMVKVLENTYRDVNIALANEAALLCETLGIDFAQVGLLANRHPRVHLHVPGPGVGGHCISVDPWFLVEAFPGEARIIRAARERNDAMPAHVVAQTRSMLEGIAQPRVALLGLAFKGNVDDIRESPALHVAEGLREAGLAVALHDPLVAHAPWPLAPLEEALRGADAVVLLTPHNAFREIDPLRAAELMRHRRLYDTRAFLDHAAWRAAGFEVKVLGAGSS